MSEVVVEKSKSECQTKSKTLRLHLTPMVSTSPASPAKNGETTPVPSPAAVPDSPTNAATATTTTSNTKTSPVLSPQLPAKSHKDKLKPQHLTFSSAFKGRNARHSIDVRTLPSYLAKKRHSTFGQFLTVFNPSTASSSSDEPLFEEPVAPTLSLGERVAWVKTSGPEFGAVRWIGRMPQIAKDWTVGIEFDNSIGSGNGTCDGRRYFVAKDNFAMFLPLSSVTKVDNYAGRPRSGTMLSRMSVQLKPGQLISIQRSPSIHVEHCSLNAPHHVGHDVHDRNAQHCLCANCNHPCAHICKTRKPKGRKQEMAHMCHFSSKPHNKLCCGGEDLPCASKPLTQTGTSWMHNTDIPAMRRTVQVSSPFESFTQFEHRRKSVSIQEKRKKKLTVRVEGKSSTRRSNAKDDKSSDNKSVSSIPSTVSHAEVYIASGVLTDESDIDSQAKQLPPNIGKISIASLRTLVSCFTTDSSSLRTKKKQKEKRKRGLKKRKRTTKHTTFNGNLYEKKYRNGLSTDSDSDSRCQTSSVMSSLSKTNTNQSPAHNKPVSTLSQTDSKSPNISNGSVADKSTSSITIDDNRIFDVDRISEGNENQDQDQDTGCTSSSKSTKSSGYVITTKADIESQTEHRSPSSHSTLSDCMSPMRRSKKSPAPPPPMPSSTSPTSLNLSLSSLSIAKSPTSLGKKRASYKKKRAPTPPNVFSLRRSMSEHEQLNMKNHIKAFPSFKSEVDLKEVSNANNSSHFGDSV